MKKMIILVAILMILAACSEKPQQKLIGNWVVDYAETFKVIKNSEIWKELGDAEREMFPDLLEDMITDMRITIDESVLITMIGTEQVHVPYNIVSSASKEVLIKTIIEEEEVQLTFRIINNNRIMFSSSATDDMDYLVWKREAVQKV